MCASHQTMPVLTQVFMLVWSYFAAFLTEPGRVPAGWSPFASNEVRCHPDVPLCTGHLMAN